MTTNGKSIDEDSCKQLAQSPLPGYWRCPLPPRLPWRWLRSSPFGSRWRTKTDGRPTEVDFWALGIFADDTTLNGSAKELQPAEDAQGGLAVFKRTIGWWGATEQEGKR